jgi:hypothetical protein
MPMMAISLSERTTAADPSIGLRQAWPATGAHSCDFSGDGRIVGAIAANRSAWLCPLFYLTVPVAALLVFAVAVVRLYRVATAR